ncbi:tRNA pseudouridine(13) synthase TruD [Patescibacteria group bacterium]|nr:tRNA pseudouridine(13) synthase TruD [Patescibacteria group bacterium]
MEGLSEVAKVLKTGRHPVPLNLSTPIRNTFHIRLRAQKKLGLAEKDLAKAKIEQLFADGYPNAFGDQRFGIE